MIDIQNLRLQLPDGFESRAGRIGRLLGDALAQYPVAQSARIDQLRVGPLTLKEGASDRQIARQIAQSIHRQIPGEG
ncbi:hypothetical protein [Marinobacter sp.]|uniref:hypothetical protein n=1 Tax=Marinobacter sp. TaxID=50741 RepID=UPI002B477B2C|nr:hypothetical protein [Marinobacter sp.]HKK56812.1 hypothetical protein [Marinobacter sp.]